MAASPRWKVYSSDAEYVAACKDVYDAAAIVALRGTGTTIRDGHSRIVWNEGAESVPAFESYDTVASTVYERTP